MKLRILMAAVLCALWAAPPLCAAPLRAVALSSDLLPGTSSGQSFGAFAVPILNDLGQAAFLSGWQMFPPSTNGLEYHTGNRAWSEATGSLASVARIGDAPPSVPAGVTIDFFNQIGFNNAGSTVIRAHLVGTGVSNTNDFATYLSNKSSGLQLVSRTGDLAPVAPAAAFRALQSLQINNGDDIVFHCTLFSGSNTDSIWLAENGLLTAVAIAGTLPGTFTGLGFREPVLNDSGAVAFSVSSRIWAGQPSGLQIIAQTGGAVPGGANGETFGQFIDPVINSAVHVAFRALTSGPAGIWTNRSGSLGPVVRGGDVAPGTTDGAVFADMPFPVLNDADRIAFRGTLAVGGDVTTSNDSGIWTDAPGALTLVAREGDAAPGTTSGTVFGQFDVNSYTLNVLGQTAFLGRLTGADITTANDVGIWATDQNGTPQLIAREGDPLEVGPGDTRTIKELMFFTGTGNGDSRMSGFNELGQLAFWARFADNTESILDNSEGIFVSYAVAVSIPGDFNHDGNVDSADYVAWRKTDGTQVGYNTWRSHFGVTSTPAAIATSVVPEPSTTMLLASFTCALFFFAPAVKPALLCQRTAVHIPMNHSARVLGCFMAVLLVSRVGLLADEQNENVATAESPADERIKKLTDDERSAIQISSDSDQVVLSIATTPFSGPKQPATATTEPWLKVFAGGRTQCRNIRVGQAERFDDTLSRAELTWLLHLATNRAQILHRTTEEIEGAYQLRDHPDRPLPSTRHLRYQLSVASGSNDLLVPELAIISMPTRVRLKLEGLEELNRYATSLNCRAILGNAHDRQVILDQLNKQLKAEQPDVPSFNFEELIWSSRIVTGLLIARFEKIHEAGPNKLIRIDADISQQSKSDPPQITIQSGPYRRPSFTPRPASK